MAKAPPPQPTGAQIVAALRSALETALGQGHDPAGLVLNLTRRDAVLIHRSESFAPDDIRFEPDGMRVMGVMSTVGLTPVSALAVLAAQGADA